MGEANLSTAKSLTPLTKAFVLYINIGFYSLLIPFKLTYDHHVDKIMAVRHTGFCKVRQSRSLTDINSHTADFLTCELFPVLDIFVAALYPWTICGGKFHLPL